MRNPSEFNHLRIKSGEMATEDSAGCNGAFVIGHSLDRSFCLLVLLSQNGSWSHAAVTKQIKSRFIGQPKQVEPNQADMQTVKAVFWKEEETCVQFFPHSKSALHPAPGYCHLWSNSIRDFPMPELPRQIRRGQPESGANVAEN